MMHCRWRNAVYIKSAFLSSRGALGCGRIPPIKHVLRWYTIEPPDWLGGKNLLIKSGKWDFPEHAQTFDEKMRSNYVFFLVVVFLLVSLYYR